MNLQNFLISIGVNVSSHIIIAVLNRLFKNKKVISDQELRQELKRASVQESKIKSIVEFLADNGVIDIKGQSIFAHDIIKYESAPGSTLNITNTSSKTPGTSVESAPEGYIRMSGKTSLTQKN